MPQIKSLLKFVYGSEVYRHRCTGPMPMNVFSSGQYNKANIFLAFIEYKLNSLLGAIYQFIFDSTFKLFAKYTIKLTSILDQVQIARSNLKPHETRTC